jgi:hypothetical protein
MDAVDSPIGPEVEQHDLSTQIRETQRPVIGMNPVQVRREAGGTNRRSG